VSASDQRPAVLHEHQWPLLEALFLEVFKHPLDRDLLRWKYGPGRGLAAAVIDHVRSDAPRAVAHCGLIVRRALVFGQPRQVAQMADLMVAPDERGRMLRQGSPFAKAVKFAFSHLGTEANPGNPDRVIYGFPSARSMRLGEHLDLVREVDQMHELTWSPRPGPLPVRVTAGDRSLVSMVDTLWRRMSSDLSGRILCVRDGRQFVERHFLHPTQTYRVYLVRSRWLGVPIAVFALREADGRLELSDWVAPLDSLDAMLDAARAVAAQHGGSTLATWMSSGPLPLLAGSADTCASLEFRIPCPADIPPDQRDRLRGSWWLTPSDTDYR
jgi:hypothetical protein